MPQPPYQLLDLLRDDDFITWVRKPNAESNAFWRQYLESFPRQKATIDLARQYINLIAEDTGRDLPTMNQRNRMWAEVKNTIRSENSDN